MSIHTCKQRDIKPIVPRSSCPGIPTFAHVCDGALSKTGVYNGNVAGRMVKVDTKKQTRASSCLNACTLWYCSFTSVVVDTVVY